MGLYKDASGQLVIAGSLPPGGTVVTAAASSATADVAPWMRSLDSNNSSDWHPARYYAEISDADKVGFEDKSTMSLGWTLIQAEYIYLINNSNSLSVSTVAFGQAFQNLDAFITPLLVNLTDISDIARATYNGLVHDYYEARAAQVSAIMTALETVGAPSGSYVAGMLADTLISTVNGHASALTALSTYATIPPVEKDLLKPLWDMVARERADLIALATIYSVDLTALNAAYAAAYALAYDLFGLSAGNHYAYANRNGTTIGFDFDGFKTALVGFRQSASALYSAILDAKIASATINAATLVGREDWEYVQSDVGVIKLGAAYSGAGTTVALTLTNKPGPSSASNIWLEFVINGKKYWFPAWEDSA